MSAVLARAWVGALFAAADSGSVTPTRHDWLRALDDLEHVYRCMFEQSVECDDVEAERLMRRALAVLHAVERDVRWSE